MKKSIPIRELNTTLEFQVKIKTDEEYTTTHTWNTVFSAKGRVVTTGGLSFQRGTPAEPLTTHVITMRYSKQVVRGMRIRSGGINYLIHKIVTDELNRRKYTVISVQQESEIV